MTTRVLRALGLGMLLAPAVPAQPQIAPAADTAFAASPDPAVPAGEAVSWPPTRLIPIEFERSAESGWLDKRVLDRRPLDDGGDPSVWTLTGTGDLTLPATTTPDGRTALRVDLQLFHDAPAPTSNGLSAVNLTRALPGDDWSGFNRLSLWVRADLSGFPALPLQLLMRNQGEVAVPDRYFREGIHYITLEDGAWHRVVWEIEPLARERVTALEFSYFVNKILAAPDDRVAFEIGGLELQRVEPDHYAGWSVAPGRIAFSHVGYPPGSSNTALASGLEAESFELVRLDDNAHPEVVLVAPVRHEVGRLGAFQVMDFSEVRTPGRYLLRAGDRRTRPFEIGTDVWRGTTWATLNFLFGERCGHAVPGSHGVCHADWTATRGDERVVMNGGWHDAGDLSQSSVNTGEVTYALLALADRLRRRGEDPALVAALLDEATWGLDWLLRVRFDGGYRVHFAGNNIWTNGIPGDADDRSAEAHDNPNVNYIAAAAGALAHRVLKEAEPDLAARSLRMAEDDWRHAIAGTEAPETRATPAFAATPMELAAIGVLASLELYASTGSARYAEKAVELARIVVASQQTRYVGTDVPLAGFFFTAPDHAHRFHQFHRGNDQAPIVALARLVETFPDHPEWMDWYATVARYAEYQKRGAQTTEPYGVLPAYVYHETDYVAIPGVAERHQGTPEAFRAQVLEGMPMGDGYYLRAFPVWFARRGNYGVLLAQAKALSVAAHLRGDGAAAELAQRQAQWVLGRNPFVQSTMYGVGYDWAQQYSVSSGDFVGSLPVGMQSHGTRDVPYWPSQNTYVYKEVWVHPSARWLWLMADIAGPAVVEGRVGRGAPATAPVRIVEAGSGAVTHATPDSAGVFRTALPAGRYEVSAADRHATVRAFPGGTHRVDLRPGALMELKIRAEEGPDGVVVLTATAAGEGLHRLRLRTANLRVEEPERTVSLGSGGEEEVRWSARVEDRSSPWVVVVVPDGDAGRRVEAFGHPGP